MNHLMINGLGISIFMFVLPNVYATGFEIEGYVSQGQYTPVSGAKVRLYDSTGTLLNSTTSGWTGGYEFEGVTTGNYVLQVEPFAIAVIVKDDDVRLDVDLNASDGRMSYGKYALQDALKLFQESQKPASGKSGGDGNIYSNDGSMVNGGGCTYVSSGGMSMKSCN